EMRQQTRHCTPGLRFYQWMMGMDNVARRHNQQRLRELSCQRGGEITFFCSHDARELDALQVNAPLR
ncbi:MBL fold metallo-hydrolase, partial [Pseudomonas sp. SIMBA_064]